MDVEETRRWCDDCDGWVLARSLGPEKPFLCTHCGAETFDWPPEEQEAQARKGGLQVWSPSQHVVNNVAVYPVIRQSKSGFDLGRFLLLTLGVILVLAIIGAAAGSPTNNTSTADSSTSSASVATGAPAPTTIPASVPVYLGVPTSNLVAIGWYEDSGQWHLGSCPAGSALDAFKAMIDAPTGRVRYFAARDGCPPPAGTWSDVMAQYLPPDAQEVAEVTDSGGQVWRHYFSGWLKERVGDGNITGTSGDAMSGFVLYVGWGPHS